MKSVISSYKSLTEKNKMYVKMGLQIVCVIVVVAIWCVF